MSAIITNELRTTIIANLEADLADSANSYYIAIGRSEDWNEADVAPDPVNSPYEILNLQHSLQSMLVVAQTSQTVPRYNWSNGTVYNAYDDADDGTGRYYVVTDSTQVYICLRQGRDAFGSLVASTVEPAGTSASPFVTADGYMWKFLYTIGAKDASDFLAANYLPVKYVTSVDSDSPISDVEQLGVQDAAVSGQIPSIRVTSGGSGYTSTPTVTIVGDGTGARAIATVSNGSVTKIEIDDSDSTFLFGSNYTYGNVLITGGGATDSAAASARLVIGPSDGFGANPTIDLNSTGLMFNAKPSGSFNNDFIIGNDFRQVAIVMNPKRDSLVDSDYREGSGICLRSLPFASVTVPFTADKTIEGNESLAQAWIDYVDSSSVYFHQNETTGFTPFKEGELVTELDGSGSGTLQVSGADGDSDAFQRADIDKYSGEVIFIDNRAAVVRSEEQTEDIKLIIQL